MKRENGWATLEKRTQDFASQISAGFQKHGLNLQIISEESLFWIHEKTGTPIRRVDQIPSSQGPKFKKLFLRCLDRGIYLAPNAYEVGFLSLAHTSGLLSECAEILVQEAHAAN